MDAHEVLRNNTQIPSDATPPLVLRLEEIVGRELSEDDIEKLQSVADVDRILQAA